MQSLTRIRNSLYDLSAQGEAFPAAAGLQNGEFRGKFLEFAAQRGVPVSQAPVAKLLKQADPASRLGQNGALKLLAALAVLNRSLDGLLPPFHAPRIGVQTLEVEPADIRLPCQRASGVEAFAGGPLALGLQFAVLGREPLERMFLHAEPGALVFEDAREAETKALHGLRHQRGD